jgi:hypothetical protein
MLNFATRRRAEKRCDSHYGGKTLRLMILLGTVSAIFALSSCVPLQEGPEIVTVSVSPTTIEFNHYNGTMSVLISVAGFTGEIVEADAFIQLPPDSPRLAPKTGFTVQGDMIELQGVPKTWFQGLPPGNYRIGASVVSSSGESIEQLDLATVQVIQ